MKFTERAIIQLFLAFKFNANFPETFRLFVYAKVLSRQAVCNTSRAVTDKVKALYTPAQKSKKLDSIHLHRFGIHVILR